MIHLAGAYTPEEGQRCVRCAFELSPPRAGLAWEEGSEAPRGWEEGAEIEKNGQWWVSLNEVTDPDAYNEDPRCEAAT